MTAPGDRADGHGVQRYVSLCLAMEMRGTTRCVPSAVYFSSLAKLDGFMLRLYIDTPTEPV